MKPLPNLEDEAAMLLRGRRSAVAAARNEAESELRDAYTVYQSADWQEMRVRLSAIELCTRRLQSIMMLWESVK